jgi:protein-tyrosine phosphatase
MTSNEQEKKPKNNVALAIIKCLTAKSMKYHYRRRRSVQVERAIMLKYNHLYMIMRYTVAKYKYGKRRINENKKYYKN